MQALPVSGTVMDCCYENGHLNGISGDDISKSCLEVGYGGRGLSMHMYIQHADEISVISDRVGPLYFLVGFLIAEGKRATNWIKAD